MIALVSLRSLRTIANKVHYVVNPFKPCSGVKWLHFKVFRTILVQTTLFNFFDIRTLWRSVLSARVPECQKVKKGGLDRGAERFGRLNFATISKSVGPKGLK